MVTVDSGTMHQGNPERLELGASHIPAEIAVGREQFLNAGPASEKCEE